MLDKNINLYERCYNLLKVFNDKKKDIYDNRMNCVADIPIFSVYSVEEKEDLFIIRLSYFGDYYKTVLEVIKLLLPNSNVNIDINTFINLSYYSLNVYIRNYTYSNEDLVEINKILNNFVYVL